MRPHQCAPDYHKTPCRKGVGSGYKMKSEMLSPAYTTNFSQLPEVKS
ncbi:DUF4113 domain-containing protein [Morganella morganii subsp. sibonii]